VRSVGLPDAVHLQEEKARYARQKGYSPARRALPWKVEIAKYQQSSGVGVVPRVSNFLSGEVKRASSIARGHSVSFFDIQSEDRRRGDEFQLLWVILNAVPVNRDPLIFS